MLDYGIQMSLNTLDDRGPKPKPLTCPKCSQVLGAELRNQYLIFLLIKMKIH